MSLSIVREDITKMEVDIIVNLANTQLKMGDGVCGAIFEAAGVKELQKECDKIGKCSIGNAVITSGYNLPAKNIIHTVAPIYSGDNSGEEIALRNCYINSLNLAKKNKAKSIAFPIVSSDFFGYPIEKAVSVATNEITSFLTTNEMQVFLVVFDKSSWQISKTLFEEIKNYIDDNLANSHNKLYEKNIINLVEKQKMFDVEEDFSCCIENEELFEANEEFSYYSENEVLIDANEDFSCCIENEELFEEKFNLKTFNSLQELLNNADLTFSECLLKLIDKSGEEDSVVYKRANVDRKHFSKIRSDKNYRPSKVTVVAFAIALKLSLDETNDLLLKAGYALSNSNKFDLIVKFFIENKNYNIFEINEALFSFDQILLGV